MSYFSAGKANEFISSISSQGLIRPNRFDVSITAPVGDNLLPSLRCESVVMPGRNIRTESNENVYGPSFEIAHGLTLSSEIQMTFLLDGKYDIKRYFDTWQKSIYNESSYDMSYYTEYVGDMIIRQLDTKDNPIFTCRVYETYPKTVNDIELSHNSRNELGRLTVTMAFRDWKEENQGAGADF